MHQLRQRITETVNKVISNYKTAILAVYALLFIGAVYHIYYSHRIIPGVYVGKVNVGGLNYTQAKDKLINFESGITKTLVIVRGDKKYEITADDIAFNYNWDAAVTRAFEVGRTGNFYVDNKDKVAGLIKKITLPAFYEYEDGLLSNKLASIKGEVNIDTKDATFALVDGKITVIKESAGTKVDGDKLFDDVMYAFNNLDYKEIKLSVIDEMPKVLSEELIPLVTEVEKVIYNPLVITKDKKQWKLTKNQLMELIKPKRNEKGKIILSLNKESYKILMDSISYEVGELPRGKVTQEKDGKVVSFELIQGGKQIDSNVFDERFKDALFQVKPTVELAMIDTSSEEDINKYGIYSLLGEGISKYTGSGAARVKNLNLAAQRTSGVLVPPGAIYSFNKAIGEVSGATGYDAGYIILGGRTVLGEGGGVCQTSTTLFRAVLNAGLPIVTRYPHAYRVVYYEIDKPVGFDAAVFQPSLDFQFRNDTPNYILIQAFPVLEESKLSFKIYGTPDGRSVEITEPVVTNQVAPPAPSYQDDPTLAKGVVRQVDFPAWGANVSFNRTVKRGEEVLYNDTFKSRYQAWRAVYLVGTKEK
ncbi:hypothetical protein GYA27_04175 [candidate division WWE3 bacterium]|uniref:YoaR-like putative peptidoglycan binding domain-containing protein n=1 Tax=candidate division WWE3 bacterium TaxID=2053526 RepID=A0A7X9HGX8_UNCKA|nr:hypothetical protein [candidate division WWE3 bacterium]